MKFDPDGLKNLIKQWSHENELVSVLSLWPLWQPKNPGFFCLEIEIFNLRSLKYLGIQELFAKLLLSWDSVVHCTVT